LSRSRKKNPIIGIACCGKGRAMKAAKTAANRKVRSTDIDTLPNGNFFRRLDERYSWPDDGKQWWDDPRAYRK
jgi:hypothetical protein